MEPRTDASQDGEAWRDRQYLISAPAKFSTPRSLFLRVAGWYKHRCIVGYPSHARVSIWTRCKGSLFYNHHVEITVVYYFIYDNESSMHPDSKRCIAYYMLGEVRSMTRTPKRFWVIHEFSLRMQQHELVNLGRGRYRHPMHFC